MADLFDLFDDKLKSKDELVASDPLTLEAISEDTGEQNLALEKIRQLQEVELKVDYRDFSNFVFLNSALDYFNITGEKILNDYPYDGSQALIEQFRSDLDGYQKYVLSAWPRRSGHLRFDPNVSGSFLKIEDVGLDGGVMRTTLLSPGSSSLSLEAWVQPSGALSDSSVRILFQKISGSSPVNGYTVYLTGSQVTFRVSSGSIVDEVSASLNGSDLKYVACVLDRTTPFTTLRIMTGSAQQFPVLVQSLSSSIVGNIDVGNSPFYICSGTLSGKSTGYFSGNLDNVRVWKDALSVADVSSSFNTKIFSQNGLIALWRFNESGSSSTAGNNSLALDYSGHKLDARIQNYYSGIRGSGSLIPFEDPDPILFFDASEVRQLVQTQQLSASVYDRENENLITRLFPEQLTVLEDELETDVFEKFVYIIARHFDLIKLRIDQFVNILRVNYGQFDQTPDALLSDVAKFFGWEFTGNFLNADAFQYLLGRDVLHNVDANRALDLKLYDVKNEFWKRTLVNLPYLYKTKGTRESVEALLRIHGVNPGLVKLKEYGYTPHAGIRTFRIFAEKSVPVLTFGSGSVTGSVTSTNFFATPQTIETRLRFPLTSSAELPATQLSGQVWSLGFSGVGGGVGWGLSPWGTGPWGGSSLISTASFYYVKDSVGSMTGTLTYSGSDGVVSLTGAFFDNEWHNVSVIRDYVSGTIGIDVRDIFDGFVTSRLSSSVSASFVTTSPQLYSLTLGSSGGLNAEFWTQETRVWNRKLIDVELDDHALNFQSYGLNNVKSDFNDLVLHWRLQEDVTASSDGNLSVNVVDQAGTGIIGFGHGFSPGVNPYRRFLNEYNYIASLDFGWNEEKIRVFDASNIGLGDQFSDNQMLSLEFNMVDALNEDLTQIFSSLDDFNNYLGLPPNRYRHEYDSLSTFRSIYFKRLQGRLNFRIFADMLEFFDRSFVDLVRRLIPARAIFQGDEFVVESHMLERPKIQYGFRKQDPPLTTAGSIRIWKR